MFVALAIIHPHNILRVISPYATVLDADIGYRKLTSLARRIRHGALATCQLNRLHCSLGPEETCMFEFDGYNLREKWGQRVDPDVNVNEIFTVRKLDQQSPPCTLEAHQ
jgi:hypothetical protein